MRKTLFAVAAIAVLATGGAMAQDALPANPANGSDAKMNSPATQNGAAMNPAPAAPATAATPATAPQAAAKPVPAEGPNFIQVQSTDMLSSNVVGLAIYNGQNDDIGKVQDIAFDSSKQVTGYILSVGGFLGMGTHYVAVNPGAVMVSYDAQNKAWRATMNATKDQLKAAPEFKYDGQWIASKS